MSDVMKKNAFADQEKRDPATPEGRIRIAKAVLRERCSRRKASSSSESMYNSSYLIGFMDAISIVSDPEEAAAVAAESGLGPEAGKEKRKTP
jgi:hypothetical protein